MRACVRLRAGTRPCVRGWLAGGWVDEPVNACLLNALQMYPLHASHYMPTAVHLPRDEDCDPRAVCCVQCTFFGTRIVIRVFDSRKSTFS